MLNVIGVGFGRTGTTSQRAALEALGFHCYQISTVIPHPERAHLWEAAADGQPVDWEELFSDYQATVDFPGAAFWRELVDAYPDAKVLLSVRDPNRWYDSIERTILHAAPQSSALGSDLLTFSKLFPPELKRMYDKVMFKRFGGLFRGREQAIEVFERHNQEVRRYVPAQRLLVYEVTRAGSHCARSSVSPCPPAYRSRTSTIPRFSGPGSRAWRCEWSVVRLMIDKPQSRMSRSSVMTE